MTSNPDYPLTSSHSVSPSVVIAAHRSYSDAMAGATLRSALIATAMAVTLWLGSLLASLGSTVGRVQLFALGPDRNSGAMAFGILSGTTIALQMLLRHGRDPETIDLPDAVAHRQFWGDIAETVALASALVGISMLAQEAVAGMRARTMDAWWMIGIVGTTGVLMLFAIDAATLASHQAERLELRSTRRAQRIDRLQSVIGRVAGGEIAHPLRALLLQGAIAGLLSVAVLSSATWPLMNDATSFWTYAGIATVLTIVTVAVAFRIAKAALLGDLLNFAPPAVCVSGLLIIFAIDGSLRIAPTIDVQFPDVGFGYASSAIIALVYGISMTCPALTTVVVLSHPRGKRWATAPILACARRSMTREVARLQQTQPPRELEVWRTFARAALILCFVPPVGAAFAAVAHWHRPFDHAPGEKLLRTAWTAVVAGFFIEIALLVLVPVVGVALGWFPTER